MQASRVDCENLLEQVVSKMREAVTPPAKVEDSLPIFLSAAIALDCPLTCRRALPATAASSWSTRQGEGSAENGLYGCSKLDVNAMPLYMLDSIPPRYLLALGRAYKEGSGSKPGREDWNLMAREFYRIMTEGPIKKPSFPFFTTCKFTSDGAIVSEKLALI